VSLVVSHNKQREGKDEFVLVLECKSEDKYLEWRDICPPPFGAYYTKKNYGFTSRESKTFIIVEKR